MNSFPWKIEPESTTSLRIAFGGAGADGYRSIASGRRDLVVVAIKRLLAAPKDKQETAISGQSYFLRYLKNGLRLTRFESQRRVGLMTKSDSL